MGLYNMVGYKLYKENEDGHIHMIRISHIRRPFKIDKNTKDPAEITVYDYDTKENSKVRVDSLKGYTPLKPDGVFTSSIVTIKDESGKIFKDVVVTGSKFVNLELKLDTIPYCVCRQNITDIFYNLMISDESQSIAGLAVNRDTCPSNFDYRMLFAADDILFNEYINFYRTDTLDDILSMINVKKYDEILKASYELYIKTKNKPEAIFKNECDGWCKNLTTLLRDNNFQSDLNQMFGIGELDFTIADYLEKATKEVIDKENPLESTTITYEVANNDFRAWLSETYNVHMKEANFLEYDHDINLNDFNNVKYILLRDNTKKLYLVVYTEDGEYFEEDLDNKSRELDFSTKFKIKFYNKYNK